MSKHSPRMWHIAPFGAALLVIVATGITAQATLARGQLTITFLDVGPADQSPQGEAILIQTPDGKTMLIDGGLDVMSLTQALNSHLPPWQHSLDAVVLTTPMQDHITGLQDIVTRYDIGEILDAGMLHPSTTYALWKRTINERHFQYVPVVQGMTIPIGLQMTLQVLWPPSHLHEGSNEQRDNGLILRLVAPGLHMLLLGVAAQSPYALAGLMTKIDSNYLQATIVQVVEEINKPLPTGLMEVLQEAHPSLLVITPALSRVRQHPSNQPSGSVAPDLFVSQVLSTRCDCQIVETQRAGTVEIDSSNDHWSMNIL